MRWLLVVLGLIAFFVSLWNPVLAAEPAAASVPATAAPVAMDAPASAG